MLLKKIFNILFQLFIYLFFFISGKYFMVLVLVNYNNPILMLENQAKEDSYIETMAK